MVYSIPYILFVLFLAVLSMIVHQRKDNVLLCRYLKMAGVMLFFAFFAFRGYIWHDWTAYYPAFEKAEWADLFQYDYAKSKEPLWLAFQLFCKTIVPNYNFFIVVIAAIETYLLVRFLKKYSCSVLFGLSAFAALGGYELCINLMRNSMAILIFLNALPYIEKKRIIPYLLACVVAAGFHLSSVAFIPLYFLLDKKINKWVFIVLVMVLHLIMFMRVSILFNLLKFANLSNELLDRKIEDYSNYGLLGVSRFIILSRMIMCILVFSFYDKLISFAKSNRIFINSFLIYIVGMYVTSELSELSNRIGFLFVYSVWILSGYLIKVWHYAGNRNIYIFYTVVFLSYNTLVGTGDYLKRYQNFLLGNADTYNVKLKDYNKFFEEPDQLIEKK